MKRFLIPRIRKNTNFLVIKVTFIICENQSDETTSSTIVVDTNYICAFEICERENGCNVFVSLTNGQIVNICKVNDADIGIKFVKFVKSDKLIKLYYEKQSDIVTYEDILEQIILG